MVRLLITLVTFWLSISWATCQDKIDEIKAWQEQNPNVRFVSYERLNLLSPGERKKLDNQKVIFFSSRISVDDITQYELLQGKNIIGHSYSEDELKKWVSEHPEVKFVKQSTYLNSPESIREEYRQCSYCLILKGEFLTLSDLTNYQIEQL